MITAKNFIEIPEVNKYFGDKFIKPKGINSKPVVVASTRYPQVVGTAIDIALKIFLAKKLGNPFPASDCTILPGFKVDELSEVYVRNLVETLTDEYRAGHLKQSTLIEASLIFALNDSFLKSTILPRDPWQDYFNVIPEISSLFEKSSKAFDGFKDVIISPDFTNLIPGLMAEGDIIVDGALIDFKTVSDKGIKKKDFNRLVLYFILCKMHPELKEKVNRIGFFFPRQVSLEIFDPGIIMDLEKMPKFQHEIKYLFHEIL